MDRLKRVWIEMKKWALDPLSPPYFVLFMTGFGVALQEHGIIGGFWALLAMQGWLLLVNDSMLKRIRASIDIHKRLIEELKVGVAQFEKAKLELEATYDQVTGTKTYDVQRRDN